MSDVNKYIGESKIVEQPTKKLSIKLGKGVVGSDNLADGAVSVNSLSTEVQLAIQSIERAGIALAQTTGTSTVMGMSQKAITDALAGVEGNYYAS